MTNKPNDAYQQVFDTFVEKTAGDYANLPPDDFNAHMQAIDRAKAQREAVSSKDERDFKRDISRQSNSEFRQNVIKNFGYDPGV